MSTISIRIGFDSHAFRIFATPYRSASALSVMVIVCVFAGFNTQKYHKCDNYNLYI